MGYSKDGPAIIADGRLDGGGGASIMWIDPTTLSVTKSVADADIASPTQGWTRLAPEAPMTMADHA